MKFPRRKRFEFRHSEAPDQPIVLKAWSEAGAWKKIRSFVMQAMFGGFALTYDPAALEREMRKITCRAVNGGMSND